MSREPVTYREHGRARSSDYLEAWDRWWAEGRYRDETFATALLAAAETWPGATMHIDGGPGAGPLTVLDLLEEASRLAAGLAGLGIGPGDAVAVQLPNWRALPVAYFATWMRGAIVVPIVHIYGPVEISFILRSCGATALIAPDRWKGVDYVQRVGELTDVPTLRHAIHVPHDGSSGPWTDLMSSQPHREPESADPADLALVLYTSGTTGRPKGVQHTHLSMLAELRSSSSLLGLTGPGSSLLNPWPAGHVAGMIAVCATVVGGCDTVFMDGWDAERAADLIHRHRCVATSGAPVHLSELVSRVSDDGQLASLRTFLVGAAAVPPSLVERADAAGVAAIRCYGCTEQPTITCAYVDAPAAVRARTDGAPREGNEVRTVGPDGVDVPPGRPGEIVARGPEQFAGYRDPADNDDAFFPGDWYRTGDIGVLDHQGNLTVTDRIKDVIIRGGENIASKEVEDVLSTMSGVIEAAVVGEPDERLGERVKAFVLLEDGASISLDEVAAHFAASGVAKQKTPERVVVAESLPRTPAGKVQKFRLRALSAPVGDTRGPAN